MQPICLQSHFRLAIVLGFLMASALTIVFPNRFAQVASAEQPAALTKPAAKAQSAATDIVAHYGSLPLAFEMNEGQADSQVKFLSRGVGYELFLTSTGALLTFRKATVPSIAQVAERGLPTGLSTASTQRVLALRLQM